MKRLKRGPEIRLSDLRMPQFLVDLYYDLDERHLIPVVIILLAGIVALPIAFGHSSDSSGEVEAGIAAPTVSGGTVVTAATTGLHNYHHRLGHLRPKDPFKSPYQHSTSATETQASSESAQATASSATTTSTEATTPTEAAPATESAGTPPAATPPEGAATQPEGAATQPGRSSTPSEPTEPTFLNYAIDVRVNPVSAGDAKPYVRRELPALTMLPSRDTPALTYMGPSNDAKKALMVVSSDVSSVFGDSRCVIGSQTCQLLALEPGAPETIVFGPHARTYRIELLKLERVESHSLDRAPLGKPKQRNGSH